MAAPPASTKTSLQQRLSAHTRQRWPQLSGVDVRFRGAFAYVTAQLRDGDHIPLMRLRYARGRVAQVEAASGIEGVFLVSPPVGRWGRTESW